MSIYGANFWNPTIEEEETKLNGESLDPLWQLTKSTTKHTQVISQFYNDTQF